MRTDILYISHGGGPMPLLADPGHQAMIEALQQKAQQLPKPDAILVISAHWEAAQATVTSSPQPSLIYDYNGFPEAAYSIQYRSPGAPKLTDFIVQTLQNEGLAASKDASRGLDHGVFVPLKIMFPEADIPVLQLSLLSSLDARSHLELGRALHALKGQNILVIGSGFSFHNMRAFYQSGVQEDSQNTEFESWLKDTCCNTTLGEAERYEQLANWQQAPHARYCHPREEHLLPLHVCYGLAGQAATEHRSVEVLGKQASMLHWVVA
ncbi:DODA-type extradiol aromatic ring-opening family dioxygenase [Aliidiomarina minuta]|uniref:DODA-type extradiol aromatic ring-opening family dioxygenase n=1 Tax=Aliidiomarina minuta TaxID=880057 RepID=UPI0023B8ADC5|nr:class III extradiol ring-cleavage dioxygenase [Aliidiomarina minuta]